MIGRRSNMILFFFTAYLLMTNTALAQTHAGHEGRQPETKTAGGQSTRKEEARVPVEVPEAQQLRIGVKIALTEKKPVQHTIRTVGVVAADERIEAHVHTKINGWIEDIFADYVGKAVKKGQPLFSLYSPDLVSTQEEYLAARQQGAIGAEIAKSSLERLRLWGVPRSEISRLVSSGHAKRTVTFDSPVNGFIISKMAIRGMYITPEMELYHLADLSKIWILVTLYESDVAVIHLGEEAIVHLPYDPAKTFQGKITYIYPEVETETRTVKARIETANNNFLLKPGMFADIEMKKNLGEAVVISEDAVIDTGVRKIVFVKTGAARFEPREVKVGPRIGNQVAILSGLKADEPVVTSAHFFIDAESKLQAAIQKGAPAATGGHAGHGGK